MPRVVGQGLIYDHHQRPADQRVVCFSSLCPLGSGEVLACFQVGPSKHSSRSTLRLCRSADEGQTWSELPARFETRLDGCPGSLAAGEPVQTANGRLLLFATWFDRSDPNRPLFDPATEGILKSRQIVCESHDGGTTFGPWRVIPTPGLTGCATTGPVLSWPDGTLAYAFESFKEYTDPSPARHAAWLAVSRDLGETFGEFHRVAHDPDMRLYHWDQRLCAAGAPGEYFAMFWTHDRQSQRDLAVHCLRGSLQGAGAHQTPAATSIPGQIAAPLRLSDGRVLAFVVDRNRPATMSLWQSRDGGATWPAEERLVVYNHEEQARVTSASNPIDFAQYWEEMGRWTFGHPAIRQMPGGDCLVAWYAGDPAGTSLHWARIAV